MNGRSTLRAALAVCAVVSYASIAAASPHHHPPESALLACHQDILDASSALTGDVEGHLGRCLTHGLDCLVSSSQSLVVLRARRGPLRRRRRQDPRERERVRAGGRVARLHARPVRRSAGGGRAEPRHAHRPLRVPHPARRDDLAARSGDVPAACRRGRRDQPPRAARGAAHPRGARLPRPGRGLPGRDRGSAVALQNVPGSDAERDRQRDPERRRRVRHPDRARDHGTERDARPSRAPPSRRRRSSSHRRPAPPARRWRRPRRRRPSSRPRQRRSSRPRPPRRRPSSRPSRRLAATPTLVPVPSATPTAVCGNGIVEGDEECDGAAIDNSSCLEDICTCDDFCDDAGGTLSCNPDCTLNFSNCTAGGCSF